MALAAAGPARAVTPTATVSATIVKPVTLTWISDLDLGTLTLGPGTWSGARIAISQAGVLTCTNTNVTCTGATKVAQYNVIGTNKQVITINAPSVTLTNQSDSTKTLTLVVDSPGSLTLTNSGQPGSTFSLGGSITLNSTTAAGTYSGTFNVTVDYN
ncbi:DUF4402 domain-containing protein [Sphingomonas sp.]|uniref:DUF4402 domain-containing protein n=1 Tax=Sphingomonas sp. TaxID=28214 RepID=UPI0025D0D567|nr:DUF4402 domain-containing protein [Sphingomonas sp.]MBV9527533.1 DUF4402 domain-containing protein [Sphingomonas sp.]